MAQGAQTEVTWHCREVSLKTTHLGSCAARAGVMAGMALLEDCSSFPPWDSGDAPVADQLATGRSLDTQYCRTERVVGPGRPADCVPGNYRSCQVDLLKPLSNQQLHEATLSSYHSEILYKKAPQNRETKIMRIFSSQTRLEHQIF
jgi:hypothetical protein